MFVLFHSNLLTIRSSGISGKLFSHTTPLKLQLAFAISYFNSRWDWQFMLLSAPVDMRHFLRIYFSIFSGTLVGTRVNSIQPLHLTQKLQWPEIKRPDLAWWWLHYRGRSTISGQGCMECAFQQWRHALLHVSQTRNWNRTHSFIEWLSYK